MCVSLFDIWELCDTVPAHADGICLDTDAPRDKR
jgi:hypothetical protein